MKRRLSLMLGISLLAVHAASAGLFYSAVNKTEGVEGSAADWRVNAWVDGDRAKIEFIESGNAMMPAGAFLLTDDAGQTVYMVNPKEGTYSRWDVEAMLRMVSNVLEAAGGMVSMTIENLSVEVLAEEPGGEIAGRSTTYYKYRTSYDLKMKIMGMKRAQSTVMNQEVWSTDKVTDPAFGLMLRKTPPSLGDSGFDDLIEAEMDKVRGFPLKTVTETVIAGRKGRETTTLMTMEVTELREESIAAKVFELDPDLVENAMPTFDAPGGEDEEKRGLRSLLKRRRDG